MDYSQFTLEQLEEESQRLTEERRKLGDRHKALAAVISERQAQVEVVSLLEGLQPAQRRALLAQAQVVGAGSIASGESVGGLKGAKAG